MSKSSSKDEIEVFDWCHECEQPIRLQRERRLFAVCGCEQIPIRVSMAIPDGWIDDLEGGE